MTGTVPDGVFSCRNHPDTLRFSACITPPGNPMDNGRLYRADTMKHVNLAFERYLTDMINDPSPDMIFDPTTEKILWTGTDVKRTPPPLSIETQSPGDIPIPGDAFREAAHAIGRRVSKSEIHRLANGFGIDETSARRVFWLAGARPKPAAAVILIGGNSMRMGTDKAFMLLDGESIAARLYKKLAPHFDDIFFSAALSQSSPVTGIRCVYDKLPGRGPLSGLATGLSASPHRVNFVIACDIPNVNIYLVRLLLSNLDEVDIAVPTFSSTRTEPLFGAYDRSVGTTAEHLLNNGFSKVITLYDYHRTRVVSTTNTGWYMNLNTPDDVRLYLETHQSDANR